MKKKTLSTYVSPVDQQKLHQMNDEGDNENILDTKLITESGEKFPVKNGIPDFTWPKDLKKVDKETRETYNYLAENYDTFASIPFKTFKTEESKVRKSMINRLELKPVDTVLEVGCGDGRGIPFILDKLGADGSLFAQELAPVFLNKAIEKVNNLNHEAEVHFSIANAAYLSFVDNYFDAAHHFGGINTFAEIEKALSELARVVKPGGKVVIGDESMGPWLRDTDMGKIMMNSNPLLKCEVPLDKLPPTAGDVEVEWIMMGAYYVLEFTVLEEEPEADYFVPIPSKRGGNHWKRYYGQLEGVSDEIKQMAYKEIERTGESMTEWLERIIKKNIKYE